MQFLFLMLALLLIPILQTLTGGLRLLWRLSSIVRGRKCSTLWLDKRRLRLNWQFGLLLTENWSNALILCLTKYHRSSLWFICTEIWKLLCWSVRLSLTKDWLGASRLEVWHCDVLRGKSDILFSWLLIWLEHFEF